MPAKSLPITTGKRCSIIPLRYPAATTRSNPLTDAAATLTSTSPSAGLGQVDFGDAGRSSEIRERQGAHGCLLMISDQVRPGRRKWKAIFQMSVRTVARTEACFQIDA